jgi:hypothetical protein
VAMDIMEVLLENLAGVKVRRRSLRLVVGRQRLSESTNNIAWDNQLDHPGNDDEGNSFKETEESYEYSDSTGFGNVSFEDKIEFPGIHLGEK